VTIEAQFLTVRVTVEAQFLTVRVTVEAQFLTVTRSMAQNTKPVFISHRPTQTYTDILSERPARTKTVIASREKRVGQCSLPRLRLMVWLGLPKFRKLLDDVQYQMP
jgi:hypothetical protein